MANDRRMTTDRFFGGVENRLANLRAMFEYIAEEEPNQPELWEWLRTNTTAEAESTLRKYVGFQRSIGLVEFVDDRYRLTSQGGRFVESADPEVMLDALLENVRGFGTIVQSIEDGQRMDEEIQSQLRYRYPDRKIPQAIVDRHIEWLRSLGIVESHDSQLLLTAAGQRLAAEFEDEHWISAEADVASTTHSDLDREDDIESLRERAERDPTESVSYTTTTREVTEYDRSDDVRRYVKGRANGTCEGCGEPAPFYDKSSAPYLEAHHIHEVSSGGPDSPETVIALCPNCHYRVHRGQDGEAYNRELAYRLTVLEDVSDEQNVLGQ